MLEDGFGNSWQKCERSDCGLEIVRPGKVQCLTCEVGAVYGFPPESRADELRRRYAFFPPTFVVCQKCGTEHVPGFDHACSEDAIRG